MSGNLICQKVAQALAPSMRDASRMSFGIAMSAVNRKIIGMPMYCHTDMSEIVGRAVAASPSSGKLTRPHSGLMMSRHRKPTMTTERVAGMKSSVR